MPPIPVYTKSPINAAKGSGVTPQTAAQDSFKKIQAPPPTTTTQATPTKTTSTYHLNGNNNNNNNNNNPPPPQPGAMPHLPQPTGTATTPSSYPHDGPPPPAPTAAAQLSGSNYSSAAFPPVPQTAIPAPSIPFNQRGTSTGMATPSRTGAAVLPGMSPYEHGPSGSGSGGYSVSAPYSSDGGQEGEGMLGSAMKFARTAGEKLSAAESEVWKRINGEK